MVDAFWQLVQVCQRLESLFDPIQVTPTTMATRNNSVLRLLAIAAMLVIATLCCLAPTVQAGGCCPPPPPPPPPCCPPPLVKKIPVPVPVESPVTLTRGYIPRVAYEPRIAYQPVTVAWRQPAMMMAAGALC